MEEYIKVIDIEKYYGTGTNVVKAVDGVSFNVNEGEFIGVMGASGSGKTTLLNMLATIDHVTSGHILYGKTDITELSDDKLSDFRRENLGFVFQDYNLLDTLTIEENILLAVTLHETKWQKEDNNKGGFGKKFHTSNEKMQKQCDDMVALLGINDIKHKFPYQVSGGQKQRCACARALVNNPKLILADEPTGALDSHSAQVLMETFMDLNTSMNTTIFMVTHDAFSASYCARILFLKDGKIFHELLRGDKKRNIFLQEILDVLSLTGGERYDG